MLSQREAVLKLIEEGFNKHDVDVIRDVATDDAVNIAGGQEIPWGELVEACKDVFKVFPDIKWEWTKLSEDGVMEEPVIVRGTHTGGAFGFGPYPPIEPTGIECINTETWQVTMDNGKIKTLEVTTPGNTLGGPPGFYVQIGGRLE